MEVAPAAPVAVEPEEVAAREEAAETAVAAVALTPPG